MLLSFLTCLAFAVPHYNALTLPCTATNSCLNEHYQLKNDMLVSSLTLVAANDKKTPTKNTISAPQPSKITERPINAARGGIITGMVIDGAGYLMFIIGGALSSSDLAVSMGLSAGGSFVLTIGSFVGTAAYTSKTNAYRNAGFDVSNVPSGKAWALTLASAGCTLGGSILALTAGGDSLAIGLISYCIVITGGVLEITNYLQRSNDWERALAEAPVATTPTSFNWQLLPTVLQDSSQSKAKLVPGLALVMQF
ncbi:MAG: hypothetical protein JW841_14745 [Deltaproteobacteria bacterium]|nr:hypothetical protein [Deltaproteobacteria bacterium]